MKVVFFGTPEFAVLPLKKLIDSEYEVSAVVTQPDRKSGRGRHLKPCPVKSEAEKHGLKVLQPEKVRDVLFISALMELNPDVIVVVAYGQILPAEIISMPEYGCVNIHASLLPKYRGAAPINMAIVNGDIETGVTTMLMDEGMDTGPILLRKSIKIMPDDTAGSLSERLSGEGAALLIPTLDGLKNSTVRPQPQQGNVSYAPTLKKSDGMINWTDSSEKVCNFIRGMNPWPGAYCFLAGERLKIVKAVPVASEEYSDGNNPGVIINASKNELHVSTGYGFISIIEIQPEGKPVMPVKAFLQGRRISTGMTFNISE